MTNIFDDKELQTFLDKHNIQYKYHTHPPVHTVEESKKVDKKVPGLSTKNLFLRDRATDNFYLVSMNAHKRLDIKDLQKSLNVKKFSFGSPEDLFSELKVKPGHCSLFAMIHANGCQLIVDKEVWDADISGFHPNRNDATLEIDHENLKKFLDAIGFDRKFVLELS